MTRKRVAPGDSRASRRWRPSADLDLAGEDASAPSVNQRIMTKNDKLKLLARDLTKDFPRSPRETLGGYVIAARIFAVIYFAFFLLMPYYTTIDKTKPVPDRVT